MVYMLIISHSNLENKVIRALLKKSLEASVYMLKYVHL